MTNKEFLEIVNGELVSFGFQRINGNYLLNLNDIIIKLFVHRNRFDNSEFLFEFTFSVKELNGDPEKIDFDPDSTHCLVLAKLFSVPKPFGNGDRLLRGTCYFNPENYDEARWRSLFSDMVERYFQPFKTDTFQAIRDANKKRNNNLFFVMKKEVAEIIGVKNY